MTAKTVLAAALLLTVAAGVSAAPKDSGGKDAVQVQTPLSGAGCGFQETNLGDLVADAVRQTGSAQVGLVPADEIDGGASIPAGKTDTAKIVSTLRYADDPSDTVVVLTLTGTQILKIAERSVSRAPTPFEGFLQVSGLQIRYSAGQPESKRVSLVGVGGSEIDAAKSYQVATTRALAAGGLGYFQILSGKNASSDTGTTLAKSVSSYLSAHPTIANTIEGRITKKLNKHGLKSAAFPRELYATDTPLPADTCPAPFAAVRLPQSNGDAGDGCAARCPFQLQRQRGVFHASGAVRSRRSPARFSGA